METNHSKDFIVRLALQSKMEEGMVSKEESGETSLVAEVDGDEHSKMFLVKMAVPSLFIAASFVAFIWFLPHLLIATGFFSLLFFLLFQCIFRQGIANKEVNRQENLDKDLQNDLKIPETVVMNTLAKALAH